MRVNDSEFHLRDIWALLGKPQSRPRARAGHPSKPQVDMTSCPCGLGSQMWIRLLILVGEASVVTYPPGVHSCIHNVHPAFKSCLEGKDKVKKTISLCTMPEPLRATV